MATVTSKATMIHNHVLLPIVKTLMTSLRQVNLVHLSHLWPIRNLALLLMIIINRKSLKERMNKAEKTLEMVKAMAKNMMMKLTRLLSKMQIIKKESAFRVRTRVSIMTNRVLQLPLTLINTTYLTQLRSLTLARLEVT